jgi:hypothetical protein
MIQARKQSFPARHPPLKSGIIKQGIFPAKFALFAALDFCGACFQGVQIDFTIYARRDGPCLERGRQIQALA